MGTPSSIEWPYSPGPHHRRRRAFADLPGSPEQPFVQRLQLRRAPLARVLDWLGLVAALTCLLRQLLQPAPGPLAHLGRMHLLLFGCACAARILRRSAAGPDAPWALLLVLGLLHGAWLLQWQVADPATYTLATPPSADGGALWALWTGPGRPALLLLVCACLPLPHLKLSYPWHLRLRAAAHSAVMLYCLRLAPLICTSAPMETPPARQLTSRLARLLSQTSLLSLHPLSMAPPAGDGAAECCAVLRFAQLVLGLLAPLALQARAEAALFQQHQRQRSRAGLPPERGFTANLHAVTCSMLHLVARPQLCICCLLTLGLCWLLAVGSAGGAASS